MLRIAAPTPKRVSWTCWAEWSAVRHALYHTDPLHRTWALTQLNVWRGRGQLPHAVEATGQLVELMANTNQSDGCSATQLTLMASMAILRFVNGLVDPAQTRGHAQSVSSLAEQMKLPRMFVDIRHDATHNQLPSLPLLLLAANQALSWLETNYWKVQERAIDGAPRLLRRRLKRYKRLLRRSGSASAIDTGSLARLLRKIAMATNYQVRELLVPTLLEHKFLLKTPLKDVEPTSGRVTHVFNKLRTLWSPALTYLVAHFPRLPTSLIIGIVDALSEGAGDSLTSQSRWRLMLLSCWMHYIADTYIISSLPALSSSITSAAAPAAAAAPMVRSTLAMKLAGIAPPVAPSTSTSTITASNADNALSSSSSSSLVDMDSESFTMRQTEALAAVDPIVERCLSRLHEWTRPALDLFLPYTPIVRRLSGRRLDQLQVISSLAKPTSTAIIDHEKKMAVAHATSTAANMGNIKRKAIDISVMDHKSLEYMQSQLAMLQAAAATSNPKRSISSTTTSTSSLSSSSTVRLVANQRFGHFTSVTAVPLDIDSQKESKNTDDTSGIVQWPPIGLHFGQQADSIIPLLVSQHESLNKRSRTHSNTDTTNDSGSSLSSIASGTESTNTSTSSIGTEDGATNDIVSSDIDSENMKKYNEDHQRSWQQYSTWNGDNAPIIRGIQHGVFLL